MDPGHNTAFETSSDIKECFDGKMIDQKLRYIHANPVSKKWRLVDDAALAFYTHATHLHRCWRLRIGVSPAVERSTRCSEGTLALFAV